MGISVISNIAAKVGPAASTAAPAAASGLPGDFAALLSGQSLAATMSSLIAGNTDPKGKTEDSGLPANGADGLDGEGAPDPSILAAMIGIPPLQPTVVQGQHTEQPESKDQGNAISGDILSALNRRPQLPEGLGAQLMEKEVSGTASAMSTLDTERQLAGLAHEAANIAADIPADSAPIANFSAAMATASMQQNEISSKQTTVNTHLTSEAWPAQFSEKIVWVAKNDLQTAQININPPQLGPIQITLNLDGNQANAIFGSPHAEVRQAIEAAMPQLREMLSSAGINLGDANVGSNLAQQNPDAQFQAANKNQSRHENAILPATENVANTGTSQVLRRGRGLVDLFA